VKAAVEVLEECKRAVKMATLLRDSYGQQAQNLLAEFLPLDVSPLTIGRD
jgi:hypothetical protein